MAVGDLDPHTGHLTTGHVWNGIRELNTPVPRIVWLCLAATAIFSVVYWILMPAWPLGATYTRGLLGIDQRERVADEIARALVERSSWTTELGQRSLTEVLEDPVLMEPVRAAAGTLFEDNCSVCHGPDGRGQQGFPSLVDDAWLWGGEPDVVAETIRVGINDSHPETRVSEMLAFGRMGILDRAALQDVVAYVRQLSGGVATSDATFGGDLSAGKTIFMDNCAACHAEDARGSIDAGAPDLTDDHWIYGGDYPSIYSTVFRGRQGQMPSWEARLSEGERKLLTLYVLDLGRTE